MVQVPQMEPIFRCKYCGQLGVGKLRIHREKKHPDLLELRRKRKETGTRTDAAHPNKDRNQETSSALNTVKISEDAQRDGNPIVRIAQIPAVEPSHMNIPRNSAEPASSSSADSENIKYCSTEDSTGVDVENEDILPSESDNLHSIDEYSLEQVGQRRSRLSFTESVSSADTEYVRYIATDEVNETISIKLEAEEFPSPTDDEATANREFNSFILDLDTGVNDEDAEMCFKKDPFLTTSSETTGLEESGLEGCTFKTKKYFYIVTAQQVSLSSPNIKKEIDPQNIQLSDATPEEYIRAPNRLTRRKLKKCPYLGCNFWVLSRVGKRRRAMRRLMCHFSGHIEDAEESLLMKQTILLGDKIVRKLRSDIIPSDKKFNC